MASSSEGRYSRFLRRALPWVVGAGVIAGAAIAATLLGGQAAAQPLTIPGIGTYEVPDDFSIPTAIPGVDFPTEGHASPDAIPAVAESAVLPEFASAEVLGKELSAPLAVPSAELPARLAIRGAEHAVPLVVRNADLPARSESLAAVRSALPVIPASGDPVAVSELAPVVVSGRELSAPLSVPSADISAPLAVPGADLMVQSVTPSALRSALPVVAAIGDSVAPVEAAPTIASGKELLAPLVRPGVGLAAPLRVPGIARSALPLVAAVGNSAAPVEIAPVAAAGQELSAPLAVPAAELSSPLVIPGTELTVPVAAVSLPSEALAAARSALPVIPAIGDSAAPADLAPVAVPPTELSIPLAVTGADFSAPLAVFSFGRPAPLTVPGAERAPTVPGIEAAAPIVIPGTATSAPLTPPGAERSTPSAAQGTDRPVPLGIPGVELSIPATVPGTGIPLPVDVIRNELALLTGVLGIKPPAPAPAPAVAPPRTHGAIAVDAARTKVGTEYSMGATGPDAFDCSGLVQWSYGQAGVKVPRTSYEQLSAGTPVSRDELELGDVVSFYGGDHSALYAGDGKVIHASTYGVGVTTSPLSSMPYAGARRY
ncbi:NlpC/P60 family protein [Nocardia sp. NPDC004278]